jgi:endonuclease I
MDKIKYFLIYFLLISSYSYAQIPPDYYTLTTGLSGSSLKNALYLTIKDHTTYPYTSSNTDVWDILKITDQDPSNLENVLLIYTSWSTNGAQEYNNGNGWEREHVWAKVHGGFGTNPPAGTDVHHIRPIHGSVNSARNSRYFAHCTTPYLMGGVTPTGSFTSTTEHIWEPRDEDKGDVARMIFYMAVRYEGENGEPDLEILDTIPSNNNEPSGVMAKLSDLLLWHLQDTVDEKERRRNDIIYYQFQHNRNPFIDHPEFVHMIWGASAGIENYEQQPTLKIYPNPTSDNVRIEIPPKMIGSTYKIFNSMKQEVRSGIFDSEIINLNIKELPVGLYFIESKSFNIVQKIAKI